MDVLRLPVVLIRHLPGILIAVAFVLVASYTFEWSPSRQVQVGLFLVAVLVLFKDEILRWVRDVLFDIGDVFSNGALTRRYITRHFLYGPITVFEDPDGLKLHLASSRPLTSGPYLEETGAFQEIVARQIDEWPSLRTVIDGFWRGFPKNPHYWRSLRNKLLETIEQGSLPPAKRSPFDDVHDLAGLGVDQHGATVNYDVLIPGRQCVFGKFARLEYIRYERSDYQFKVGRSIDYDWIGFHVFSHCDFLFGRDHDSLGSRESGSSEKDGSGNRASKSHICLLGLT